jgi:hypothetical protein
LRSAFSTDCLAWVGEPCGRLCLVAGGPRIGAGSRIADRVPGWHRLHQHGSQLFFPPKDEPVIRSLSRTQVGYFESWSQLPLTYPAGFCGRSSRFLFRAYFDESGNRKPYVKSSERTDLLGGIVNPRDGGPHDCQSEELSPINYVESRLRLWSLRCRVKTIDVNTQSADQTANQNNSCV